MEILQAKTYCSRLKGLLGKDSLPADTGLLLEPCKQVHTFFMKFTIDVVHIDKNNIIIHLETLKPNKLGKYVREAKAVIEFPEGTIKKQQYAVGQVLPPSFDKNKKIN